MSNASYEFQKPSVVNVQLNESDIATLLGLCKTSQMRIVNRINNGNGHDRESILRKLSRIKKVQEKLEQGALTF